MVSPQNQQGKLMFAIELNDVFDGKTLDKDIAIKDKTKTTPLTSNSKNRTKILVENSGRDIVQEFARHTTK